MILSSASYCHPLVNTPPILLSTHRPPEDRVMSEGLTSPPVVVNFILGKEDTVMREDHVKNLFEDVCSLPLVPFTIASQSDSQLCLCCLNKTEEIDVDSEVVFCEATVIFFS
jgi:hypothetical protein